MQLNSNFFFNSHLVTITLFLCNFLPIHSDTPHIICQQQNPSLIVHYKLADLGETDLEPNDLTKLKSGPKLSPAINNAGEVIGNRKAGAFINKPERGEYVPCITGAKINFYGLNNNSDILVGIQRQNGSLEWLIWPTKEGWNCQRISIDTCELESSKVSLTAINDCRVLIGTAQPLQNSMPVIWFPDPKWGLKRIGSWEDIDLFGTAYGLNNRNMVVGHSHACLNHFLMYGMDAE
jgi:hypothetical protein